MMRSLLGGVSPVVRRVAAAPSGALSQLVSPASGRSPSGGDAPASCVAPHFLASAPRQWHRAPKVHVFALAGGLGAAAVSRRAFSSTVRRQASEPAPNVASALPEGASDAVNNALSTITDPAIFGWWPSSFAELGIVAVQEATGLPWWQCIAGITLGVRTMLFPLVIYQVPSPPPLCRLESPDISLPHLYGRLNAPRAAAIFCRPVGTWG